MDLVQPAVLLALGALLGFLTSLGGQAVARRWSRQDRREDREHDEAAARRAEVHRRTDAAAVEALDELQHLRELYASKAADDDLPDEAAILRRLERSSLLIRGPGRAPLMDVVRLLRRADEIEQFSSDSARRAVWVLCNWGCDTLGAVLRADPLPAEPPGLQAYREAVQFWEGVLEEQEAQARAAGR